MLEARRQSDVPNRLETESTMRLFLLALVLLTSLPQTGMTRIRLLLRDATDAGVAGATLMLRTESGQSFQLTTDASGVAVSDMLTGKAVWLMSGRLADGTALVADSYPAGAGFRLVLIGGQVRDALLRLDGERLVLDPEMIFAPDADASLAAPTPAALAATLAPRSTPAAQIAGVPMPTMPAGDTPTAPAAARAAHGIVLALALLGALLLPLALLIGLARRRPA